MITKLHANRLFEFMLMVLVLITLDQISKTWVLEALLVRTPHAIKVTEFFSLVLVYNYGVSFGMLALPGTWMPYVLKALALLISLVLTVLTARSACARERLAYGFIVGGALGNVIDRVRYGAVVDFIYLHIGNLGWPAFNVADSAIFIGVAYLIWQSVCLKSPKIPLQSDT